VIEQFSIDGGKHGASFFGHYEAELTSGKISVDFNGAPRFKAQKFVHMLADEQHDGSASGFGVTITVDSLDPDEVKEELEMLWLSMIHAARRADRQSAEISQ
jgi:hypothetical protein